MSTFQINKPTGLLVPARYCASSHCDERPADLAIDMIVIHNISLPPGQFGGGSIEQFFTGQLDFGAHPYFATISALRVSAHLLITRLGEVIQFVPFTKRAWHAGQSTFQGRTTCNDFSVGIELEGTDEVAFTEVQYHVLRDVIKALLQTYSAISLDRIVGHSEIAPGRKTDPGPCFDWPYLRSLL